MRLAATVLVALAQVGIVIVVRAALARWARQLPDAALAIRPPTYRFTGADEALALRTRKRRDAADAIRARAHKVETGAKVADVLRLVKK